MENLNFVLFFVALAFLAFFLYRSRNSLSKYLLDELRVQLQKEFLFNREELSKNLHENRIELTQSLQRLNDTILKKAKDDRYELRNTLKEFESSFVKNVETFNTTQKDKKIPRKVNKDIDLHSKKPKAQIKQPTKIAIKWSILFILLPFHFRLEARGRRKAKITTKGVNDKS